MRGTAWGVLAFVPALAACSFDSDGNAPGTVPDAGCPCATRGRDGVVQSGLGIHHDSRGLRSLAHDLGRSTIKCILADAGIEPAPERSGRTPWATFLEAQWGAIAALDFFAVEVLTMDWLVRCAVLFAIDLKTRCLHLACIAHDPYGGWMEQIARNLTDVVDGFLIYYFRKSSREA
jgi:hypothetical protein